MSRQGGGSTGRAPGPGSGSPTPPARGVERRTVRYRLVRLGDTPDEPCSAEIGRLDRGDEVDVLEWRDGSVRVRTPEGIEGWIAPPPILAGGRAVADDDPQP